jgi:hypothetical protein
MKAARFGQVEAIERSLEVRCQGAGCGTMVQCLVPTAIALP